MIKLCAPTDEAAVNIDDAIKAMRSMGVGLAEIRDVNGINVLDFTNEQANEFYEKLKAKGIEVWAISSPIGKRDFAIDFNAYQDRVKKAIEMAKIFHAPHIRVFSFFNHNNNVDEVVKRLSYVVEEAKKENIKVCLENEKGTYGETPERMLELLDKIPGLLMVYDSSNYIQVGVPSDKTLSMAFPRAYYVHFKDGIHKGDDADITPVGEGEANIAQLLKLSTLRDMTFSIEHHLRYPNEGETFEQIQNSQKFVYPNRTAAFYDAVGHARMMLLKGGYMEIHEGLFKH
ncbi:MAG: sugar phosphate isomerase/epimerase [Bacilli bacterium]|nr:sugar phosphate isomerase/epimerase [Bacilli bacterium]